MLEIAPSQLSQHQWNIKGVSTNSLESQNIRQKVADQTAGLASPMPKTLLSEPAAKIIGKMVFLT